MHTANKTVKSLKTASSKATAKLEALDLKYQHSNKDFKDLSNDDLALLAGILAHQPPPTLPKTSSQHRVYAQLTKSDVEKLPAHLRSYPSSLMRYVVRITCDTPDLCSLHHELCPQQMSSILRFIRREIDVHIPAIHRDLRDAGVVSVEVHELFKRVREVSAMWTRAERYLEMFERYPKPQWTFQKDGCTACVLARLGGEPDVLVALKAGMIMRSKTNAISSSRRHSYLDSLIINGYVAEEADALMHRAMRLGAEIRYQWTVLIAKKRENKRDQRAIAAVKDKEESITKIAAVPLADNGGEYIYNDVNDIIDEYLRSSTFDPCNNFFDSSETSNSQTCSSMYANSIAHPPPALDPRLPPGKSHHTKSHSDNAPYPGATSYAISYQNVLGNSGPYQRIDKRGKGEAKMERTELPGSKPRPHTQVGPLTPKKSPAGSEGTTWGGFLERVNRVQDSGRGK